MFWSDLTVDTISRAKLDGSEVTVLVNSGLSTVGKGGRSLSQQVHVEVCIHPSIL